MNHKKIIPFINAENEYPANVIQLANRYSCEGADELFLYNYTGDEASREEFLSTVREIEKQIDIPFTVGIYVSRFEDAKKALYTGASSVVIRKALLPEEKELNEILRRFDRDKLAVEVDMKADFQNAEQLNAFYEQGFDVTPLDASEEMCKLAEIHTGLEVLNMAYEDMEFDEVSNVYGVSTNYFEDKDIYKAKRALKQNGIAVEVFESLIDFADFKLDANGLIPAIVQDYRTGEVLMLGYMNEESYAKTIETGRMTYFSRSRQKLWLKGETSGHFQYVKSLSLDCDNDTILAKVSQVGAACHTGNRTCFYRDLVKKEFNNVNPLEVFENVYQIIKDRKEHPKEGSYTNYLFDKGIDKILKKVGEECTELVIAAKNPDPEEIKYEMSDFLYHAMVLMVERGVTWEDITEELANR